MRPLIVLAVLVACAACAGKPKPDRDAAPGEPDGDVDGDAPADADLDASPDAPTDAMVDAAPDAPPGRGQVTVRVVDKNGDGIAGLHVVYIDTDATVTHVQTDSTGSTQANVFAGAHVTAVRPSATNMAFSLTTVQALQPGDVVTLISAPSALSSLEDPFSQRTVPLPAHFITSAEDTGSTATFTTLNPHDLAAGDTVTIAGVSVGGYNGTFTVAAAPTPTTFTASVGGNLADGTGGSAAKSDRFTVTYPAYTGASNYEIHHPCGITVSTVTSTTLLFREGCASATGDVLVFARTGFGEVLAWTEKAGITFTPGGNTTITDTWHARETITASYSNPTNRVSAIEVERFAPYVRGLPEADASECINEVAGTNPSCVDAPPVMMALTAARPAMAVMKTRLLCEPGSATGCISSNLGVAQQVHTHAISGTASLYSHDVGANLLPWVNAEYDPTTTTIDLTVTGTGAIDIFEANLRYTRGQVIYTWRVFGPTAEDVTFPTLPSSVPGDPTVLPTDAMSSYQVWLGESDAIAGYRDAIDNVYEALGTCEAIATPSVRRYGGTVSRISRWN